VPFEVHGPVHREQITVTEQFFNKPTIRLYKAHSFREKIDQYFQYWALAPVILVLLILTIFPFIQLISMSFSTVSFAEGKVNWVYTGLDNYYTFLKDEVFRIAVGNTLIFVVTTVIAEMILGFTLALFASQTARLAGVVRSVMMIPILVPAIAIGVMWRLMYNYEFGIFNQALSLFGLKPLIWTGSAELALPSVIIVDIWHWTAFVFLLMLAGIESLPQEPMEAARVDGASDWQLLRYVILPLLSPTILVTLMFRTIFAFKVFDEVYLLTSGGPGSSSEVISRYIDMVFFSQSRMGYGAFLSILTIILVAVFIIIYTRVSKTRSRTS
jgi:multiple sugar transport system permease protein